VLTIYLAAAMLAVIVCAGGRLARLAQVRIRYSWLLWLALADQIVIISVIPDSHHTPLAVAHIASYVLAGICVVFNRRLPGILLIGLGGALNGLVIAINGGTLPTSAEALSTAGRAADADQFTNSGVVDSPRLAFLGDAFATPAWVPGHTVFSIGDVVIWVGIGWFLWRTCRRSVEPAAATAESVLSTVDSRHGAVAGHPAPPAVHRRRRGNHRGGAHRRLTAAGGIGCGEGVAADRRASGV
jgi:hypothetical protein